jgi:hypothetical protein
MLSTIHLRVPISCYSTDELNNFKELPENKDKGIEV